jgi:HAD superfamily hydrolase (TIGR01509 family)
MDNPLRTIKKIKESKGYIFDLDGTLAYSQQFHFDAYDIILKDFGIKYTREMDENLYAGQGSDEIMPLIFTHNGKTISVEDAKKLVVKKRGIYDHLINNSPINPVPGIKDFLIKAKEEGKQVIIATGNRAEIARIIIEKTGIAEYFDTIVTNSHVDNPKPAPDIFLYAAKILNLPADECIIFEDAPNVIKGAKNFTFTCVGIASGNSKKMLKTAGADIIVKDYLELLDIIS